jgi:hypothetical protein
MDNAGHLWLFGGSGGGSGPNGDTVELLDLWEFDPSTKEWTWMGGSSNSNCVYCFQPGVYGTLGTPASGNHPGGRFDATSWTDRSGNLWLFGGQGGSYNNDLWEFNPSTSEWAWMGGSVDVPNTLGKPGVYGTLGIPAAGNVPGGRAEASNWTDSSGNFWLFGGYGLDADGDEGWLNDLWEFTPSTNQWAWIGGGSTIPANSEGEAGNPGVYGTLGMPATGNVPGGHSYAMNWIDKSNNLWLFGGYGIAANGYRALLNDLWEFNPSTGEWAWMGGGEANGQAGIYGTLGIPAAGNVPGSRQYASGWTDQNGNFWLLGGNAFDANGNYSHLNDLWEYQPPAPLLTSTTAVTSSVNPLSSGQSVTFMATVAGSGSTTTVPTGNLVFNVDGAPAETFTLNNAGTASYSTSSLTGGQHTIQAVYSGDSTFASSTSAALTETVLQTQTITFTPTSPVTLGVAPITLAATGGASGNPVTFSIVSGPGTLSGTNNSVLTVTGVGTIVIAANQAGSSSYTGAPQVTASIVVQPPTPATITSPAAGSTLTGSTVTLTWTAATGVTQYDLHVGTTGAGSSNIFGGVVTGQSKTVTGIPTTGGTLNVRLYSLISGAWQYIDYAFTEESPAAPATITSPAPGSALTSSTATLTWTTGSQVTQYDLRVGTTGAGSSNIFGGVVTGQSKTVTGIPTTGATLNVRLYSLIAGAWQYVDYTYTEASPATPAAMTAPIPGSTLTLSSATFSWTTGSQVTQYDLKIGTTGAGSSNIFGGVVTGQSKTVTGIPTTGSTLNVRLYSLISGAWQYIDYTYMEASPAAPATLTSPTPSSTLTGSSTTFGWTTGSLVTQYNLKVGTTGVGSYNLFGGTVTGQSQTVTGIPTTGGTLYVRLSSLIAGAWQYTDYTYTEVSPAAATMTSPTPSSTLSGPSATFTWTTGSLVTEYDLKVGTTGVGSYNIFSGIIAGQSQAVTGIPTTGGTLYVRLESLISGTWQYTDYTYTTGNPTAMLSVTSLTFAARNQGTTSSAQGFVVTNNGGAALTVSSISLTGTNPTSFSVSSNTCGSSLAPEATCDIAVTFTAASALSLKSLS